MFKSVLLCDIASCNCRVMIELSCKISFCWLYDDRFSSTRRVGSASEGTRLPVDRWDDKWWWPNKTSSEYHPCWFKAATSRFTLGPLPFDWLFRIGLLGRRFLPFYRQTLIDRQLAFSLTNHRVTHYCDPQRAVGVTLHTVYLSPF